MALCVSVQWTPEGRRLVTGASSGEFTLWNGLTFNFETILQVTPPYPSSFMVNCDGAVGVVSMSDDEVFTSQWGVWLGLTSNADSASLFPTAALCPWAVLQSGTRGSSPAHLYAKLPAFEQSHGDMK